MRAARGLICLICLCAAPAGADTWDGSYAGFQFGLVAATSDAGPDDEGPHAGGHLGYGFTLGDYVVGGEIDHDRTGVTLGAGGATTSSVSRLKLRAGTGLGGALLYGTAGLAQADTSGGTENGYFVGAGIGHEVPGGWVLGGEILYHNFLDIGGTGDDAEATTLGFRASFRF